jgi:ATP-binding cassette subfamily C (CFTR/MRP) protein 1
VVFPISVEVRKEVVALDQTSKQVIQDLELIDDELPPALELTVNAALSCVIEGFLVFVGETVEGF